MGKLPIAIQAFSIRDDAQNNFTETMQAIKDMGYDGVELAGLYGYAPEEIKEILGKIGLIPISAHVPFQFFEKDIEATVKDYASIGCRFLAIPYLTEDYRYGTDNFNKVMEYIPLIAKACKKEGITLLYHNHDFEYLKTAEGEYILDYMYRTIPEDELKMELDTCWAKVAGVEPTEYLAQYKGRCPIVHVKDYNPEPFEFRAVGYGIQDVEAILKASVATGAEWIVVEQDSHPQNSALEDARLSREYLRTLGW